jgi:hypothetical protein
MLVNFGHVMLTKVLTIPVGYANCFEARGVAGYVLWGSWAETRDIEVAAKAKIVERATGDIFTMQILWYYKGKKKKAGRGR